MMPAINHKQTLYLSTLLQGIAVVPQNKDRRVDGLAIDSRKVTRGDLFLAASGSQVHGVYFAQQAIERGAIGVLIEKNPAVDSEIASLKNNTDLPLIEVDKLSQTIGLIAERFYMNPSQELLTVGVTGTNGKTSFSHFLAQALDRDQPSAVIGTIGNGLIKRLEQATHTTPDAVSLHALFRQLCNDGAHSVVMEVSSHGLEQGRVSGVSFDVAVFTNLSRDHLDYHGSMQNYRNAKKQLFLVPNLKHAVINGDDEFGQELLELIPDSVNKVCYGIGSPGKLSGLSVRASEIEFSPLGIQFKVNSPWGSGVVRTNLLGRFNISNLLAVLSTLLVLDVHFTKAISRIEKLQTVPGRMQRLENSQDLPLVIVDYAHTPDAVEKALLALREHMQQSRGKIHCVFGCGGDRDSGKRAQMGACAEQHVDHLIITNDNPRSENPQNIIADIMGGLKNSKDIEVILDRTQAIATAIKRAAADDAVIILGKGHEQYQIIGAKKLEYAGDFAVAEQVLSEMNGVT